MLQNVDGWLKIVYIYHSVPSLMKQLNIAVNLSIVTVSLDAQKDVKMFKSRYIVFHYTCVCERPTD